ncbi:MAG: phospholipid carrier-dependent glycosyltransferase [Lachnospiraceae bacterium]|nr:phospholipid carrier-dependent glycosyltransferase [Lachnospiraceae bacterium]
MCILTVAFTIMVFFKLGNTYAPIDYYQTTEENRDIVIDFGDYITVEKLHIFLGNYDSRKLSISTFNEVTGKWEIINSEANVGSVLQWNDIDIYYTLRYLGLVSTDDKAVFNEFVFTGPDGIITPVNTADYPELFDEQDMYPTTEQATYMDGTMFDEIYYARTGYEFNHHLPAYETTHPQLGKCLIALGMKIFGTNPFGWRIMVALFGVFFVPLMYMFAKVIFKDTFIATCVGVFITFDCMHYTLSRICTIDIFVAFFIILMYYYMYRYFEADREYRQTKESKKDAFPPKQVYMLLALSGIAMGMAISTKLTGVYAAIGLAILFFMHLVGFWPNKQAKKLFWFCVLFFIALPLVIYTLPYIPVVEAGALTGSTDRSISASNGMIYIGYGWTGLIAKTVRNTSYLINYHKNLTATHPFQSSAQSWPFIYRSLLAANDRVKTYVSGDTTVYINSSVSYIGNPVIWWASIPCVLFTFYSWFAKKDRTAGFLCIAYLAQYLPWFGVNRCIFIYHYLPAMLFAMFMMGYTIQKILQWNEKSKKFVYAFLALAIIMFFIFFPVISGVPVADTWGNKLEWFDTWALV